MLIPIVLMLRNNECNRTQYAWDMLIGKKLGLTLLLGGRDNTWCYLEDGKIPFHLR